MLYEVVYHPEVDAYLESLEKKSATDKKTKGLLKSIRYHIELLKIMGNQLPMPYARHIEGGIWELRPANNRIFYAFYEQNTFIMLHYYHKKTQKAPKGEIEKAKRTLKEMKEKK
jgi:phage-related protein